MIFLERCWPANRHVSKNAPHDVKETVKAIRKVHKAHGSDKANRAYAEAMSDVDRKEWAECNGFVQVEGGHEWFVRFLGKTCICMTGGDCGLAAWEPLRVPYLDHTSYWQGEDGRKVLVAQPYGLRDLRELGAWADRHDLTIKVSAWSFYFPGRSLMIEVQRRGGEK